MCQSAVLSIAKAITFVSLCPHVDRHRPSKLQ
jgi:hypothetical protein